MQTIAFSIKSTRDFGVKAVVQLFVMEGTRNTFFGSSTTDLPFRILSQSSDKKNQNDDLAQEINWRAK